MDQTRSFFQLPLEQKKEIDYIHSPAFRGYIGVGIETTAGRPDVREQVEIAAEKPEMQADAWPPYYRLNGPNQWPEALPSLRSTVEEYVHHMTQLSSELTDALCLSLGVERTVLNQLIFNGPPHWQLKLASYQPSPASDAVRNVTERSLGVGAHTDSGFLTLLLQDHVGGLQAFSQGEWLDVPPAGLDVLVCNLGEVAQLLSGGYLLATPHRVLSSSSTRLSIPYFFNPTLSATVSAMELPSHLPWERERDYEESLHWKQANNAMLGEYGYNALKSLARSHSEVFKTHHPDLQVLSDGRVIKRTST